MNDLLCDRCESAPAKADLRDETRSPTLKERLCLPCVEVRRTENRVAHRRAPRVAPREAVS